MLSIMPIEQRFTFVFFQPTAFFTSTFVYGIYPVSRPESIESEA
jgi:hypothetical protein